MGEADRRQSGVCMCVCVSQKTTLEVICLFINLFFIDLEFTNNLFVHLVPDARVPHWIYKYIPPRSGFCFFFFFYLTWALYRIPVLLFIRQTLYQLSYLLSCLRFIYSGRENRGRHNILPQHSCSCLNKSVG